jgi:Big-like domain-containing protein
MKRTRTFVVAIGLAAIAVLLLSGCDMRSLFGRSGELSVEPTNDVVLADTTVVFDEAATETLTSASPDGSVLTFATGSEAVATLETGDVMVIGVSEHSPGGLLRKVESITISGDETIVVTSQAAIEDAVQEGEMTVEHELVPATATEMIAYYPGVTLRNLESGVDPALAMSNTFTVDLHCVPVDLDDDPDNGENQITIDGSLEFTLGFKLNIKVSWFKLSKVEFSVFAGESLTLDAFANFSREIQKRIEIGRINFSPICFMAGPLPVWITPRIVLSVGLDGSVSAELHSSLTQGMSVEPYLRWTRDSGEWTSGIDFVNDGFEVGPPEASASCEAKLSAGPELQMLLYGVAGPLLGAEGYLEFCMTASPHTGIDWALYRGFAVNIGASLSAIGNLEDIRIPVLDFRDLILESSDAESDVEVDDDYGFGEDEEDDAADPAIVLTVPVDGAELVDASDPVAIFFNDTVDPSSVVDNVTVAVTADGEALCGTYALCRTGTLGTPTLQFRPDGGSFPSPAQITVVLTDGGIMDDEERLLSPAYEFSFTTGEPKELILGFQDDLATYSIVGSGEVVEYPIAGTLVIERTHGLAISSCVTGLWDYDQHDESGEIYDVTTLACTDVTVPAGVSRILFDYYLIGEEDDGGVQGDEVAFTVIGPDGTETVRSAETVEGEGSDFSFEEGDVQYSNRYRFGLQTHVVDLTGLCDAGDQIDFEIAVNDTDLGYIYLDCFALVDAIRFE